MKYLALTLTLAASLTGCLGTQLNPGGCPEHSFYYTFGGKTYYRGDDGKCFPPSSVPFYDNGVRMILPSPQGAY